MEPADRATPDRRGEPIPEFLLPGTAGSLSTFYELYCGRPTVIVGAAAVEQLAQLRAIAGHVDCLGVVTERSGSAEGLPFPVIRADGDLLAALFPEGLAFDLMPVALLLDARLRIADRVFRATPERVLAVLTGCDSPAPEMRYVTRAAPVLMIPDVFSDSLCRRLIERHHSDAAPSGMIRLRNGRPELVPDPRVKVRQDHALTDPSLVVEVERALVSRILPAIRQAFCFEVDRHEGFKVVRYDADAGGHFALHRDNVTPDAAHRRFALSVNLDGEHEGGHLRFPEFDDADYHPPAGGAIVFSGALLHRAVPVTRGSRYVLLTFLWNSGRPVA